MRFSMVAILGLALASTPAVAQQSNSNSTTGHSFGSMTCPQRITCPDSGGTPDVTVDAATVSKCITRYWGYKSESGFFDDSEDLDQNNCLISKPNVIPKGMGAQLIPYCCITQLPDSSCAYHCELITTK